MSKNQLKTGFIFIDIALTALVFSFLAQTTWKTTPMRPFPLGIPWDST